MGALGLFRFGLLELMPVARDVVIENISEGIIVLDNQGIILDLNPSAQRSVWKNASLMEMKSATMS